MKNYLRYTLVNPKLISGKSRIHGEGVFASEKISAGEKLMEFGGVTTSRADALGDTYRSRSVWVVDKNHSLALPKTDTHESLDEYLNHSCHANAWLIDEVTLAAKEDIAAGDEITMDQGTWNFEDNAYTDNHEPCFCGATECRGVLTESDWKIPSVQDNYRGHFHPLIQEMIDIEAGDSIALSSDK